ncbi:MULTISPECIES: S8 family serine peptidase [Micromonospora]|uniref:Peptidase n=1 Tax=Micromonospora solifontis TaxID=2487138 RepID=A0ABX9WGQ7_9ACTN|nr:MULTISPECIES: S8 family serine peptidase [Micromonospora]NES14714.1 S8 family serine peptidase [Micromonospora sp. PPF5-17B]NES36695.1 S8 family serine peptidase [Micromonospora solifontis]NES55722.1 S8 family serine peptidase [Micromonospora sp. PPF5-6]RNL99157.1 peptidase [Micromonospora solifontis]
MPRSTRRLLAVTVAAALAAAPGTPAVAGSQPSPPAAPGAAETSDTVTLVTGDVVRVTHPASGPDVVTVDRSNGSTGGVHTEMVGQDLYVIPDEALPHLAANRLDRELFNVTDLIEDGFDDTHASELPLIATYPGGGTARAAARTAPAKARKVRDLRSINGMALSTAKKDAASFWRALAPAGGSTRFAGGVGKLWLDGRVRVDLADSVAQVGAPQAWSAGYDGKGTTVAVLDTGVDATHPDLAGKVKEAVSFVPGVDTVDRDGHGTHVASTVAGSGAASGGAEKGVAPGADLVVGKVLDDGGFGQDSWIIAGMEWAAHHAKVVNMSLGSPEPSDGTDPMAQAVERLTAETGTLFVIAAGNSYDESTIGSPAAADAALTVAAVDGADVRADFSSQGPRYGDNGLKPDISAPGVQILAARATQSPGTGSYVEMSGTSMATPHVAGAAAIVAAKHPDWPAARLKDALMSASKQLADTTPYQVGAGRLDVPAALGDIQATGSADLGFFTWPHDGDQPVSRTVTYANSGTEAVTLVLALALTGPDGKPAGLGAVSPGRVTVPAGGTATATVTADPDDVAGTGRYTGALVATDGTGKVRAHTALGLVKEDERYDLKVHAVGRDGKPAGGYVTVYRYGDFFVRTVALDPETGTVGPLRLPPGEYNVTTWLTVAGDGPDSVGVALLGTPSLKLDADRSVELDARQAHKVTVTTPRPSEDSYRRVQYFRDSGIGGPYAAFTNVYTVPPDVDDVYVAPTGQVTGGSYEFAARWSREVDHLTLAGHTPSAVPLDPRYQAGSARLDGKVDLAATYVGSGTAADFQGRDVKGKAVLVTRDDTVFPGEVAAAAEAAGAALLVLVNDRPGPYYTFAGGTDLPVVSLTRAEGERVLPAARAGTLRLRGNAVAFSPYTYDLVRAWPGEVPADPTYAPTEKELARVDQSFHAGSPSLAFDLRADCRSYHWPPCLGIYQPVAAPSTRVDYLSTRDGTSWYQEVQLMPGWEQRHDQVTYRPGEHVTRSWFSPVTRPRLGPGYWYPYRDGDFFAVNVPPAGGDGGITGSVDDGVSTVTSRLYQNGTLVGREQPYQAVQEEVPPTDGTAEYRFEQDTTRPADPWVTSTRTRTVWAFHSARPADRALLPLLQLDYRIDTDLTGAVRAGSQQKIGLAASHVDGAAGAGPVTGATLSVSYDDGATWQPVSLTAAGGGSWKATLRYPSSTGFVSLKATARDDAGNTVAQEIIRAYRLA